ncbi:ATP-binding protein [Anaeromonas frigoriresistens]|nr:sensor histidine kinase [Anaeromonas frigoriresistens]
MNNFKKRGYIALADAAASQFFLGYIIEGFRITLSVVIFPVLLYLYKELNPIITALFTGIIGVIIRSIFMVLSGYTFMEGLYHSYPEIVFYIVYGILYYFLLYRVKESSKSQWLISIIICDFASNLSEVIFRIIIIGGRDFNHIIRSLLIIALLRGILAFLILISINYYKFLAVKKEHQERYRRLIDLSVDIESEVYYMNMNIDYIEKVMTNSYHLYEKLDDENKKEEREIALQIAKDVHEIKKNYIRVIDGIEGIMENKIRYVSMTLEDIVGILRKNIDSYIQRNNLNTRITYDIEGNVSVSKHYYLMSILRNLLMNSLESIDNDLGEIDLVYKTQKNNHIFLIKDNGKGIKDKNIDYIFHPGFSTKFNQDSGAIKRGIGLTLVKDIVEKIFNGKIFVESNTEVTVFRIVIPIGKLEEK